MLLIWRYKHKRFSSCACTACTTDTMDVTFRFTRNFKVYYELNIIHIESSCSDVCCYKNLTNTLLECIKCSCTLTLIKISIEICCSITILFKLVCDCLCISLSLSKYDGFLSFMLIKNMHHSREFVRERQINIRMINSINRDSCRYFNIDEVTAVLSDYIFDFIVDSC